MSKSLFFIFAVFSLITIPGFSAQAAPQARGVTGDTCRNSGIIFKSVAEADKSLNLSSAFITSTVVEKTYTTSWSGSMTCTYGNVGIGGVFQDHLYYFTGFNNNPVYLNFNSADGESSYWIKVTSEITGSSKVTVSGIVGYTLSPTKRNIPCEQSYFPRRLLGCRPIPKPPPAVR